VSGAPRPRPSRRWPAGRRPDGGIDPTPAGLRSSSSRPESPEAPPTLPDPLPGFVRRRLQKAPHVRRSRVPRHVVHPGSFGTRCARVRSAYRCGPGSFGMPVRLVRSAYRCARVRSVLVAPGFVWHTGAPGLFGPAAALWAASPGIRSR
jgi:hypothetical protein